MRIAVLADIHGNLLALQAVLADLERRGADLVVDLGDCVSGPLWPRETLQLLAELRAPTVRGNHDRQVATLLPQEMGPSDRFAHGELTSQERARLGALPKTAFVAEGVLACHGTPVRDDAYLIEEIADGRLRPARPEAVAERLRDEGAGEADSRVVLCGHSHRPGLVWLQGGRLVLNPGSVGGPAYEDTSPPHVSESGSPLARYALLDLDPLAAGLGQPLGSAVRAVELLAVPYAHEEAARRAEANERLDWAHALRTGFSLGPG